VSIVASWGSVECGNNNDRPNKLLVRPGRFKILPVSPSLVIGAATSWGRGCPKSGRNGAEVTPRVSLPQQRLPSHWSDTQRRRVKRCSCGLVEIDRLHPASRQSSSSSDETMGQPMTLVAHSTPPRQHRPNKRMWPPFFVTPGRGTKPYWALHSEGHTWLARLGELLVGAAVVGCALTHHHGNDCPRQPPAAGRAPPAPAAAARPSATRAPPPPPPPPRHRARCGVMPPPLLVVAPAARRAAGPPVGGCRPPPRPVATPLHAAACGRRSTRRGGRRWDDTGGGGGGGNRTRRGGGLPAARGGQGAAQAVALRPPPLAG